MHGSPTGPEEGIGFWVDGNSVNPAFGLKLPGPCPTWARVRVGVPKIKPRANIEPIIEVVFIRPPHKNMGFSAKSSPVCQRGDEI
ncbi:hypothetical protein B9T16_26450 [Arthrospira sp. PCC 8006]